MTTVAVRYYSAEFRLVAFYLGGPKVNRRFAWVAFEDGVQLILFMEMIQESRITKDDKPIKITAGTETICIDASSDLRTWSFGMLQHS